MSLISHSVHGDSLAVLSELPTDSFDHAIIDPPYNMSKKRGLPWAFSKHVTMQESWDRFSHDEFFEFCVQWIGETTRVVKPNGNLFLFGTFHNIYLLGFILQKMDLKVLNSIIWFKPNAQPNITCRMLTESSEQIVWAANNPSKKATKWTFNYKVAKELNGGKQMRNVWEFPLTPRRERIAEHPSQKPLALMKRLVKIGSNPGDIILDPFAGTGTTGHAALAEGRRFFLIDRENKYIEAQRSRFQDAGFGDPVKFSTQAEIKHIINELDQSPSPLDPPVDAIA